MIGQQKIDSILNYLDEVIPNPLCSLNYTSDYSLLIAVMLSAQTTDARVNLVTPILFNKYRSLEDLSKAEIFALESILKPLGNYRKKAKFVKEIATIICESYGGLVPKNREELEALPGIGRKTVNVFLSEYYKEEHIAVDTHVERVSKRLGLARKNDSVETVEKLLMKKFPKSKWSRLHLQMVLFGRNKCKAIKPICSDCKLVDMCKEKNKNM